MNELNKKLAAIQKELKAPKSQFNSFGNYNYRSCEDILEAVKPLLGDISLTISDEVVNIGDRYYVKAHATIDDGDHFISAIAYAREPESKKGMDESQITGATSSYARKYALNGLFAIDDTKDADTQDNTDNDGTKKVVASKVNKTQVNKTHKKDDDLTIFDELADNAVCEVCGKEVSRRVEEYSKDKYGRVLCMEHQLKEKK